MKEEKKYVCCAMCASCCKGNEKLMLTPRDVFAIAYQFGMEIQKVVESLRTSRKENGFPIVFLPEAGDACTYYQKENGRCSLARKPDVCAAYPYGNEIWFGKNQPIPFAKCDAPTVTKKDWVWLLGLEDQSSFYSKWNQACSVIEMLLEKTPDADREMAATSAFHLLYERYDTSKKFVEQFDANVLKLVGVLSREEFYE